MALSSGFGWYSLSGILLTDAFGPVLGSVGFFNDLAREIAAIMLIPLLINRHRAAALGLGGATTMDFTLPVLQRSGGVSIVPPRLCTALSSVCLPRADSPVYLKSENVCHNNGF